MTDRKWRFRIGLFVLFVAALATLLSLFGLFPNVAPRETQVGQPEDHNAVAPDSCLDDRPAINHVSFLDPASAAPPPAQDALDRIAQSLERLERTLPQIERTLEEYRLLGRELNRSVPDLRATNTALQR